MPNAAKCSFATTQACSFNRARARARSLPFPSSLRSLASPRRAFTFVEILAAMLFMAIVIPIAVQGLMASNRMGVVAQRKRIAAQLADMQLTDMVVSGAWQTGNQSGDFGEDFPGFEWQLLSEDWTEDTMGMISMIVYFKVQERQYDVVLTTLIDTSSDTESTSTDSTTAGQSSTGGTSQ